MSKSAQAVRRLPLRQAIQTLRSAEGSSTLRPNVKSLTMRFIPKNAESGPRSVLLPKRLYTDLISWYREFIASIAPRIAYSNPSIPINIHRLRDPRGAEKSKDPKDPNRHSDWALGEAKPTPEMVVDFRGSCFSSVQASLMDVRTRLMISGRIGSNDIIRRVVGFGDI
jgi:hypothetical protein